MKYEFGCQPADWGGASKTTQPIENCNTNFKQAVASA